MTADIGTLEKEKKQGVDAKLRSELSDYLAKKFMVKNSCSTCWGTGVRVWQRIKEGEMHYTPCHCLRLIRKNSNETKIVANAEESRTSKAD